MADPGDQGDLPAQGWVFIKGAQPKLPDRSASRRDIMPFVRLWRPLILVFLAVAVFSPVALAQGVGNTGNALIEEQRGNIDRYSRQADELEKRIAASSEEDGRLVEIRLQFEELARELLAGAVAFRPRLSEIK